MKVAVTGSSGLIGTALVASLRADGHDVVRLVRRVPRGSDEVRWDPRAADAGLIPSGPSGPSAPDRLDGLGACVHLAGAGVMDHRWTARYKAEIRASRLLGTRALAGALIKLGVPPATLLALLDRKDVSGPVNLTAPAPVTDAELTAALHAAAGRRDLPWLRVPGPVLRLALGEASAELLSNASILPARLLQAGYGFRYPALTEALSAELAAR